MRSTGGLALLFSLVLGAITSLPSAAEAQPRSEKTSPEKKSAKSGDAKKAEKRAEAKKKSKPGKREARSIGSPNAGRLVDGMRLRATPHLVSRKGAHTWGLPALVRLLRNASKEVASKHRGAVVFVGDLSARSGGSIAGHNSHQSGRDADVGFFITNSKGKPVNVKRFVAFDADGRSREPSWARFDDARNWTLVEALLNDPAGVRYLFVSTGLRARLLAYAKRKGKSDAIIQRAAAAMMSPKDADLHDDHFHVRIACPESMRGACVEESGPRPAPAPEPIAGSPSPKATPEAAPEAKQAPEVKETPEVKPASEAKPAPEAKPIGDVAHADEPPPF